MQKNTSMTNKFLVYYVKRNSPYFWQLQIEGTEKPIGHFKTRSDAVNFFLEKRIESVIIFQNENNVFVGAIVSKQINKRLKYQIKIVKLAEIATLEDKEIYKISLANEFQINLLNEEDALNNESRKRNYQNTFIIYKNYK